MSNAMLAEMSDSFEGELVAEAAARPPSAEAGELVAGKLWRPRRVLITPDAYALPHGRRMLERAESLERPWCDYPQID